MTEKRRLRRWLGAGVVAALMAVSVGFGFQARKAEQAMIKAEQADAIAIRAESQAQAIQKDGAR